MAVVLKFPGPDARLRRALASVYMDLEQVQETLRACAIRLAAEGVWRDACDEFPGILDGVSADTLMRSGDDLVRRLTELELALSALNREVARRGARK